MYGYNIQCYYTKIGIYGYHIYAQQTEIRNYYTIPQGGKPTRCRQANFRVRQKKSKLAPTKKGGWSQMERWAWEEIKPLLATDRGLTFQVHNCISSFHLHPLRPLSPRTQFPGKNGINVRDPGINFRNAGIKWDKRPQDEEIKWYWNPGLLYEMG